MGLYAVRLYVNGRARIVVVDDNIPYHTMLHAMTYSLDKREYWIQLLEKAWAKVQGNYELAGGGYTQNGLRLITGAPVFTYLCSSISSSSALDSAFDII